MEVFKLNAEPRTVLGKKAAAALRKENKIPVVLNGGDVVELPYKEALLPVRRLLKSVTARA